MANLFFAVLSSAAMSVVLRISESKGNHKYAVFAMNYLAAILMALPNLTQRTFFPGEGNRFAVLLGMLNGILYLGTLLILEMNIRKNGVILSSTFAKLGVVVPTVFAVLIFSEIPTTFQILGLINALAAMIVIHFEKEETMITWKSGLVFLMFGSGSADSLAKVFEYYGKENLNGHFLLYTFVFAFILCVVLLIYKKQKITKQDVVFGFLVGIPNYLSMFFLLKALSEVKAVAAYPTYSAGTIIVVSITGVILFKEYLSKKQWCGMGLILGALVLLNI